MAREVQMSFSSLLELNPRKSHEPEGHQPRGDEGDAQALRWLTEPAPDPVP